MMIYQEKIADSLKEKKSAIEEFGKESIVDRYFLCDEFDLSNFPKGHPCFCDENTKWFMRLKFEHAPHRILKTISPMPKVICRRN